VRSLVKPLSSWVYGGGAAASLAAGLQTVISFDDLAALPKAEGLTLTRQLRDDDRVLQVGGARVDVHAAPCFAQEPMR
jgi:hypothetical protein